MKLRTEPSKCWRLADAKSNLYALTQYEHILLVGVEVWSKVRPVEWIFRLKKYSSPAFWLHQNWRDCKRVPSAHTAEHFLNELLRHTENIPQETRIIACECSNTL